MIKNSMQNLIRKIILSVSRFPLSALCSVIFCVISIMHSHQIKIEKLENYLAILSSGYCWFISLKLFAESRKLKPACYYAVGAITFLLIAFYIYTSYI